MLRRQLPVHSPVSWSAVGAGLRVSLLGAGKERYGERISGLLAARFGAKDVLLVDSGTSALGLAIVGALGSTGGSVALPGYCCYDIATAAEAAGARALLYDIDPFTLGPDLESLGKVFRAGATAVVVAHLFGVPVDVPAVRREAGEALVIEDAAQGVGGTLGGRRLGSFGSLSVLSFGRGKGITGGGGGALLALDEHGQEALDLVREAASEPGRGVGGLGAMAAQLVLGRPTLYAVPAAMPFLHLGETRYHAPSPPRGMPAAWLAALERNVVEADRAVPVWRRNAGQLADAVSRCGWLRAFDKSASAEPGYLRLPAVVVDGDRGVVGARARRLGVATGYPETLAALPSLHPHLVDPRPVLPGATELSRRLVTLPTHGLLTESDVGALERWLGQESP